MRYQSKLNVIILIRAVYAHFPSLILSIWVLLVMLLSPPPVSISYNLHQMFRSIRVCVLSQQPLFVSDCRSKSPLISLIPATCTYNFFALICFLTNISN